MKTLSLILSAILLFAANLSPALASEDQTVMSQDALEQTLNGDVMVDETMTDDMEALSSSSNGRYKWLCIYTDADGDKHKGFSWSKEKAKHSAWEKCHFGDEVALAGSKGNNGNGDDDQDEEQDEEQDDGNSCRFVKCKKIKMSRNW